MNTNRNEYAYSSSETEALETEASGTEASETDAQHNNRVLEELLAFSSFPWSLIRTISRELVRVKVSKQNLRSHLKKDKK